jgi:hypothetical protein
MRQSVRLARTTSMSASATPIPLPTCDRNLTPRPVQRPLLWLAPKKPAIASPGRWRAVPQSPHRHPYPRLKSINPRKRQNNWKRMQLPEKSRHAHIRSWICLGWGIVQRVVSSSGRALLTPGVANIDHDRFCAGRTSVSSSSRTHVPYFRYFGPTAIVPGFKQMVRICSMCMH